MTLRLLKKSKLQS